MIYIQEFVFFAIFRSLIMIIIWDIHI